MSLPTTIYGKCSEPSEKHSSSVLEIECSAVDEMVSNVVVTENTLKEKEPQNRKDKEDGEQLCGLILNGSGDDRQILQVDNNDISMKCHQDERRDEGVNCKHTDELSVKTLANMFDFKIGVTTSTIPTYKTFSKLEDNRLFQKGRQNVDHMAANTATSMGAQFNESEC